MDKQKKIEEMAYIMLDGEIKRDKGKIDCSMFDLETTLKFGIQRLAGATALIEAGYGNVKEALAEFADMLKKRLCDGVFGDEDVYTEGKWYTPKYLISEEIDNMKERILK